MENTSKNEHGAGRIAAALSASLTALFELQKSQKRIEDRQKKSEEELARYSELLLQTNSSLDRGMGTVDGRIESVRKSTEALGRSIEKSINEKKSIWWKHHLRAGGVVLGALVFGCLIGHMWALNWLRLDETARMSMEKERMTIKNEWLSMVNEKLAMDAERDIGHTVIAKVEYADDEQRDLIVLLLSSESMSKKQRKKLRKWLKAQSRKKLKWEESLDVDKIVKATKARRLNSSRKK